MISKFFKFNWQSPPLWQLKGWDSEVLSQSEEVSIDMSGNYRNLVEKMLPNAEIVADRFHVTKLLGDELNRARNQEKKAINKLEDKDEQENLKAVLSNSKYALLKPEKNRLSSSHGYNLNLLK